MSLPPRTITFSADGAVSRIEEVIPSLDREHSTAFRNYDDVWVERIPLLAEGINILD